ncbi:MAG TPA: T9SS type A sorting domain-containing protein [Ignavibacteria bacterium]|nr:T9SS type A sorting domain-containing protein [Ignavibacteria bacterium]
MKIRKTIFQPVLSVIALLFCAANIAAQWISVSSGSNGMAQYLSIYSLAVNNGTIYAGSSNDGVYSSGNNGNNWSLVQGLPPTGANCWALYSNGSSIFAGYFTGSANSYRSTNNGTNWLMMVMPDMYARDFILKGPFLFASCWGGSVLRSTNNGANWIQMSNGITGGGLWHMTISGSYLFVTAQNGGVFRTSNDGSNWTQVISGLSYPVVYSLCTSGSRVFAGSDGAGIFVTTNNGDNWSPTGQQNGTIYDMLVSGNTIIAGGTLGIKTSTNNGTNWVEHNQGLTSGNVSCLVNDGVYLYAGTLGGSVYRRPLNEMLSVELLLGNVPQKFRLEQNYPNPFNPTTRINFDIQQTAMVKLKVYDITGKEVSTIVNEILKAGEYAAEFDGSNFTSGAYFCKLETQDFTETRKMILIK